jgi:hypothetical protein
MNNSNNYSPVSTLIAMAVASDVHRASIPFVVTIAQVVQVTA